ncbi:MAG TPA: hypothetical protein VNT79_11825 [Phycisphaerae bacterium]|nr:hypothetical protein [Phycisphaerae bacterium]
MWLAEIGKFVGAKVAGTIITVAVVAGGIWCYYNWDQVQGWGHVVKLVLVWLLVVAVLPWSSWFYMRPLLDYQHALTNAKLASYVSVAVIAAHLLIDVLIALWLADWSITGSFTWFVVLLGFAAAAAYNFVICESLARYVDS